MTILERIAERRIAEAQRRGAFDQLTGHGRPLELEDDSAVPPEWRAAFRVLKRAGYVPEWIALGREIDAARVQLLSKLASTASAGPDLMAEAAALNRKIREFNLRVPLSSLQKPIQKI